MIDILGYATLGYLNDKGPQAAVLNGDWDDRPFPTPEALEAFVEENGGVAKSATLLAVALVPIAVLTPAGVESDEDIQAELDRISAETGLHLTTEQA